MLFSGWIARNAWKSGVLTALQVEDPLNWAAQLSIGYIITQIPGSYLEFSVVSRLIGRCFCTTVTTLLLPLKTLSILSD